MTPYTFIQTWAVSLFVFLVLDFAWLGWIARGFYRSQLGPLMASTVNWAAALAFYCLFVAGVVVFVVAPALERDSLVRAVLLGALFGLVTYATYDLTNLATLRGFPAVMVPVDMAWGAVLTAVVASAGYLFAAR